MARGKSPDSMARWTAKRSPSTAARLRPIWLSTREVTMIALGDHGSRSSAAALQRRAGSGSSARSRLSAWSTGRSLVREPSDSGGELLLRFGREGAIQNAPAAGARARAARVWGPWAAESKGNSEDSERSGLYHSLPARL